MSSNTKVISDPTSQSINDDGPSEIWFDASPHPSPQPQSTTTQSNRVTDDINMTTNDTNIELSELPPAESSKPEPQPEAAVAGNEDIVWALDINVHDTMKRDDWDAVHVWKLTYAARRRSDNTTIGDELSVTVGGPWRDRKSSQELLKRSSPRKIHIIPKICGFYWHRERLSVRDLAWEEKRIAVQEEDWLGDLQASLDRFQATEGLTDEEWMFDGILADLVSKGRLDAAKLETTRESFRNSFFWDLRDKREHPQNYPEMWEQFSDSGRSVDPSCPCVVM